jgi:hypothetical protein
MGVHAVMKLPVTSGSRDVLFRCRVTFHNAIELEEYYPSFDHSKYLHRYQLKLSIYIPVDTLTTMAVFFGP